MGLPTPEKRGIERFCEQLALTTDQFAEYSHNETRNRLDNAIAMLMAAEQTPDNVEAYASALLDYWPRISAYFRYRTNDDVLAFLRVGRGVGAFRRVVGLLLLRLRVPKEFLLEMLPSPPPKSICIGETVAFLNLNCMDNDGISMPFDDNASAEALITWLSVPRHFDGKSAMQMCGSIETLVHMNNGRLHYSTPGLRSKARFRLGWMRRPLHQYIMAKFMPLLIRGDNLQRFISDTKAEHSMRVWHAVNHNYLCELSLATSFWTVYVRLWIFALAFPNFSSLQHRKMLLRIDASMNAVRARRTTTTTTMQSTSSTITE